MALFLRSQDDRSELQQRVAAELQERLRTTTELKAEPTEPTILEHQHETRWAGVVIVVALIVATAIILITVIRS